MKKLIEAKIERFGYKDYCGRISTLCQITYIWDKSFLGIHKIESEKLPLLFRNKEDAIDFIECGGRIKKNVWMYPIKYEHCVYVDSDPDHLINVNTEKLYGFETLYIILNYWNNEDDLRYIGPRLSDFFKALKEKEEKELKRKHREEKENEYIKSLYEVKTYKIEKNITSFYE